MKRQFGLNLRAELQQSYNIGAGQNAYVLTAKTSELQIFRWGFIPSWAKTEKVGENLINANAEGIATAFSFRMAIRQRRCLIFADSYYAWQKQPGTETRAYRLYAKDQSILAFAGLWDSWLHPQDYLVKSFAVMTTRATPPFSHLVDTMPIVLRNEKDQQLWLSDSPLEEILKLLDKPQEDFLQYYPIGNEVENLENNYPELHKNLNHK